MCTAVTACVFLFLFFCFLLLFFYSLGTSTVSSAVIQTSLVNILDIMFVCMICQLGGVKDTDHTYLVNNYF